MRSCRARPAIGRLGAVRTRLPLALWISWPLGDGWFSGRGRSAMTFFMTRVEVRRWTPGSRAGCWS
jgi:hypothetical protein